MKRASTKLLVPKVLLLSLVMSTCLCPLAMGQVAAQGKWQTLPNLMPINPVHVALMRNGKVLVVSGSGNVDNNPNFQAGVYDPQASTWRDDFTSSTLDPSWSFAGVDNSSYSLTADPGHLQMNVPAGSDHDCWNTSLNCARMLRSVSNSDAIYETKIDGVNIGTADQTYGIFLQQDSANFLRFEFWTDGSGVRPAAWKNIGGIGSNAIYGPVITLGSSNYLRVTRTGGTFQLDYSTDGSTWVTAGSFTQAGFSVNKAGLHVDNAGGSSAPATTGNFDYFQIQSSMITQAVTWDMFCNGMVVLPDGRPFINGGTLAYDPAFRGELRTSVYDPGTGQFTDLQSMAHGRWYPTVTVLGDGTVMTFSGLTETTGTNTAVEIYTVGAGWSQQFGAGWTPPLYPRMHVLPDGTVFYSGSGWGSMSFNPSTKAWTNVAYTNYGMDRRYGSSVLLPLTPASSYKPRVMIFGGGDPATATTEIIDLSATNPHWVYGPSMSQSRIEMNATILPNGKVLATGGSRNDEDATTASLNADLYDPNTNTFSSAGANAFPRLYHSNSLLLPDATVLLLGGNPARGTYEQHMEIYSPAYLFNGNGSLATRPTITGVTPTDISFGRTFQVQTPDAANIASVVLMRPGAPTHAFDMEQRLVALSYTVGSGVLNVTAPPNGNIAPPGYYMLFVLNSAGVPSIASFVQLSALADQPPTATITSPAADVTVNPGQSVFFSGTGSDPDGTITAYSWTFAGGNPNSSSLATPGYVTYSTPGTYVASLTVTDNAGLTSLSPATRTVSVSDFSLSAAPASRTVLPGGSTSYTATVTPGTGFSGVVTFNVSGLPSGAAVTFSPTSVTGTGSSTMNVTTSSATLPGTYQLTVTGSSGGATHGATVTLVVGVPPLPL